LRGVPFVEVAAADNRRDRRATVPAAAFVSVEIFDEPWHLCGAQTQSRERRKFVHGHAVPLNERNGISLALSHQRMAGKAAGQPAPVKAVKPAEPGARGASLDGRRMVRHRLAKR
jgi:hypothetical protein